MVRGGFVKVLKVLLILFRIVFPILLFMMFMSIAFSIGFGASPYETEIVLMWALLGLFIIGYILQYFRKLKIAGFLTIGISPIVILLLSPLFL